MCWILTIGYCAFLSICKRRSTESLEIIRVQKGEKKKYAVKCESDTIEIGLKGAKTAEIAMYIFKGVEVI